MSEKTKRPWVIVRPHDKRCRLTAPGQKPDYVWFFDGSTAWQDFRRRKHHVLIGFCNDPDCTAKVQLDTMAMPKALGIPAGPRRKRKARGE